MHDTIRRVRRTKYPSFLRGKHRISTEMRNALDSLCGPSEAPITDEAEIVRAALSAYLRRNCATYVARE